jgi:hypothetical protein
MLGSGVEQEIIKFLKERLLWTSKGKNQDISAGGFNRF